MMEINLESVTQVYLIIINLKDNLVIDVPNMTLISVLIVVFNGKKLNSANLHNNKRNKFLCFGLG